MALSGRECPDCRRRIREPFQQTITGREVCPDCADALRGGTIIGVVRLERDGGDPPWTPLLRRLTRRRPPVT